MGIPQSHAVPTRKQWQKLRDAAGGKSGLAKASIGPNLDAFHKALTKAEKTNDAKVMHKEILNLRKATDAYISEVSKTHSKLAKVAKEKIAFPLKDFIANCDSKDGSDRGQEDTQRSLAAAIKSCDSSFDQIDKIVKVTDSKLRRIQAQVEAGNIPSDTKKSLVKDHAELTTVYGKIQKTLINTKKRIKDDEDKLGKDIDVKLKKAASTAMIDLDEKLHLTMDLIKRLEDYKKDLK